KIPTGTKGSVYDTESAVGASLIGRSSAGTAGLIVLPGVIDADYTGEILIAAFTLSPPLVITKGTRVAQLVIFERHSAVKTDRLRAPARENQGFGSTGSTSINLVQTMQQRPLEVLRLSCEYGQCRVQAMMDSGLHLT
ncbi:DUT nucleotidohydrolase, partial [Campylorhamphus procurvoides]|nr:DUT nucleotidohydrolase [Campylorhamphus procurvoides]